jgi:signal transduction histidine kinase
MHVHLEATRDRASSPRGEHVSINQGELRSVLSSLSHELCRPLVSLRAGFDLLLGDGSGSISADQRVHLLTMVSLCDDLLRLTRGYLDYAGLVDGCRRPCYGTFSIGAITREIDQQFGPIASARGLKWETTTPDPSATVITDASLCQQIFGNLVSNALKYTPRGGRVEVKGHVDGDHWSVVVSDDGPGIPAEFVEKVFEPFYRLPRDEHSRIEGNGLGLSICHELIARMNGQIFLDSRQGSGTVALVRFPVKPFAPSDPAPNSGSRVAGASRSGQGARGPRCVSGHPE